IQGNGFFILSDGNQEYYTRAGNFSMDTSGRLVYSNGLQLQGWLADNDGNIYTSNPMQGITLPINSTIDPKATSLINLTGNLNSGTANSDSFARNVEVYDSLGNTHILKITFTKTAENQWDYSVVDENGNPVTGGTGNIEFNPANGHLDPASITTINLTYDPTGGAAANQPIQIDLSALTQQHATESNIGYGQDGYEMGYLDTYKIDSSGTVVGVFTNGLTKNIAQIAVANFPNPAGLEKVGETMFRKTSNSGEPDKNVPGVGGCGTISPGTLEMSNVDLSQEFTDMIVTQRGFQANSRIITTSDEMLQELVNLKR
ncbi:MAG TPA: flagellar hook protein FlgE, partial [Capillibacterium sp.]